MATIYDYEMGTEITAGLQGSDRCDEAWQVATGVAKDRGRDVVLEDDDGVWRIDPDGHREAIAADWAD